MLLKYAAKKRNFIDHEVIENFNKIYKENKELLEYQMICTLSKKITQVP
jgi:RNA-splicing ligase RtcB